MWYKSSARRNRERSIVPRIKTADDNCLTAVSFALKLAPLVEACIIQTVVKCMKWGD